MPLPLLTAATVPLVLASASTHLMAGMGACDVRGLKKGDVPRVGDAVAGPMRRGTFPMEIRRGLVNVTEGPQRSWFRDGLGGAVNRAAEDSNRMGLRLLGPRLEASRQLLSEGASLGAIQVPPEGQPIIECVAMGRALELLGEQEAGICSLT